MRIAQLSFNHTLRCNHCGALSSQNDVNEATAQAAVDNPNFDLIDEVCPICHYTGRLTELSTAEIESIFVASARLNRVSRYLYTKLDTARRSGRHDLANYYKNGWLAVDNTLKSVLKGRPEVQK